MTAFMANKKWKARQNLANIQKIWGGMFWWCPLWRHYFFRGKEKNPSIFKLQICLSCFSKDYLRFSNNKFLDFKFRVVWTTVMIWGRKLNIGWFGIRSGNQGWFIGGGRPQIPMDMIHMIYLWIWMSHSLHLTSVGRNVPSQWVSVMV